MSYSYSSISFQGAATYANGINDAGKVVGDYFSNGTTTGFVDNNGTFTSVTYPGSPDTYLIGINASGQIVGHALTANGDQGFIYNNGTFTPLSYPGALGTDPQGINDAGQVVGTWSGNNSNGSFLYSNGTYSLVKPPADATGASTSATGIDNAGQIVGSYIGDNVPGYSGQDLGFIATNGSFTYLAEQGAGATYGHAVSGNTGEIAGFANFASSPYPAAFTESNGTFSSFAYPNATFTTAQGVNDSGQVVGQYSDGTGVHSFVATPLAAVCFAAGTRIRAIRGGAEADVAVEDLAVGDLVVTASGRRRPVRWLGNRAVDCRIHLQPEAALPVRVEADALGAGRPARALLVSPGHSLAIDLLGEVLMPASALCNGATVRQLAPEDLADGTVTYWHVELDSHDLLLAENLPAESYLDMGNRAFFAGSAVVDLAAGPDAPDPARRTHADFCRPFHAEGPLVAFVRQRLHARAAALGWRLDGTDDWADAHLAVDGMRLDGTLDGLTGRFRLPAGADDVWVVSNTGMPWHAGDSEDRRVLGLHLAGLEVEGGRCGPRAVALDDPLLCVGFHHVEIAVDGHRRWTTGRARLPQALWAGLDGPVILTLRLAPSPLRRWVGPGAAAPHPYALSAAA